VWILGFLTFLAGLNTLNAVVRWALEGRDWVFEPYLIGIFTGEMQVTTYFWASVIAMFLFLGLTAIIAYSKPPPDPAILGRIVGIEEELATNRGLLESTQIGLYRRLEDNERAREELFNKINATLRDVREKTVGALEKQEKEIRKIREDLSPMIKADLADARKEMASILEKQGEAMQKVLLSAIETNVSAIREEMLGLLEKHGEAIRKVERLSRRGAATIEKQMAELATLGTRLERLERELLPKPRLTSQSSPEEIKGVGPRLGEELRSIGITNAGELITADPAIIAERTRVSPEMATRLQAKAQLLMVPGIDENDVELLEEAGITTRRELAEQDAIELSRKIGEIAKTYVEQGKISESEKPTIEEISSWIKLAKP
jgi:predicted flap endonuclease-1-like 5' DNA nuclease